MEKRMKEWITCVRKARRGDLDAFDTLVVRFRDMAVGYAYSLLKDFHRAEDAAQEAFIRAYRDIGMLKEPCAFPSWLRKIVFKYCDRISRRKEHHTIPIDNAGEQPDYSETPVQKVMREETEKSVLSCVENLPENEREVTTLFYINGYSMAEVGTFLDLPVSTVKSRLHSARKKIRQRMVTMVKDTLKKHAPDEGFNSRIRSVLENVPLVNFELHRTKGKDGIPRCPETVPFPSCVRAYLEYLDQGEPPSIIESHNRKWRLDNSYLTALCASGAAFKLNWRPGWHMDNPLISHISDDPLEPHKRTLDVMGIPCEIVLNDGTNKVLFTEKIRESIRKNKRPVIAQGVVGPPEECLVTGFDKNGEILLGWSFFQGSKEFLDEVEFEPNGYFRKRNWYENTGVLFVPGDRNTKKSPVESYKRILLWAVEVMERPTGGPGIPNGLAAYRAWIDTIADDEAFSGKTVKELQYRYIIHHSAVGLLAECRWYAHLFLDNISEVTGKYEPLKEAASCFNTVHTIMWEIWGAVGGPGVAPAKAKRFAGPDVRKQVAGLLEKAREMDVKALDAMKASL
ncbi:MAG: RNA polymerase sigma factor [Spirochaetales bacterium]|nr:RNA polymerase sigma factor [Spirochaetales bacterium]